MPRIIFIIGLLVFFIGGGLTVSAQTIAVPPDFPLPITSQKYSEAEGARIFFKLYPIFSNAYTSLNRRDYEQAEAYFNAILKIDPGNNLARYYLMDIYNRTGKPRQVLMQADQLLRSYPDYIQGHLSRGYALWALKDQSGALQAFSQALTLSPPPRQRAETLRALAEAQAALGQHEKAAAGFQQAYVLSERPEDLFQAAQANKKLGRYEIAATQFQNLAGQPGTPKPLQLESLLELARLAVIKKEKQNALDYFLKVLELDPDHLEALRGAANGYFLLGRWNDGLPLARRLVTREPGAEDYLLLGAYEERLKHFGPAAEAYEGAAARTQDAALLSEAYQRLGQIALLRRQPETALEYFRKGLLLSKTPAQRAANRKAMGTALIQEKKFAQSGPYFQESLRDKWDEETARLLLQAWREAREWERLAGTGETLLADKRTSPALAALVKKELIAAYQQLGQEEKLYGLSKTLAGDPSGTEYLGLAAEAARKTGRLEEAQAGYERVLAARFDPRVALDLYYLLKQQQRYPEGERLLRQVLEHPASAPRWRPTASYELAQVYRLTQRDDLYLKQLEALVRETPAPLWNREWAEVLWVRGRSDEALSAFLTVLDFSELEGAQRCDILLSISTIYLDQKKPKEALDWLERLERQCPTSLPVHYEKGLALYALGEYRRAIPLLEKAARQQPAAHLYLAFAYYKLGETGLALTHLEQSGTGRATPEERSAYESTRAYLLFEQSRFTEGLTAAGEAQALREDRAWTLFRLKTLQRLNCPEGSQTEIEAFLGQGPPAEMAAEAEKIMGICLLAQGELKDAIERFSRSIQQAAGEQETYYLRGLAYYRDGQYEEAEKDFEHYLKNTPQPRPEFFRDLGFVLWAVDKRPEALEAWEKELETYPSDLNTTRNAGYGYLKLVQNKEAKGKFARAIDIYADKLLYLTGAKYVQEYDEMQDMKKEYTKLNKTWGAEFYLGKTDLVQGGAGTIFNGAIPSQFGAQLSYRPPVIGFRNERQFDAYARFLGNFQPDSWSPDPDSYQLGLGVAYKPLGFQNFYTSFERLIKIGKNAEDNWLWRNRLSLDWDQPPKGGRNWWVAPRLYGEASYFLQDPTRWVFYAEGRLGLTWRPWQQLWITPQILGDYRYETNQNPVGCYREIGLGISARFWEGERKYTVDRWYVEGFFGYKWGWFEYLPAGMTHHDFEGFFVGLSFAL